MSRKPMRRKRKRKRFAINSSIKNVLTPDNENVQERKSTFDFLFKSELNTRIKRIHDKKGIVNIHNLLVPQDKTIIYITNIKRKL